MEKETYEQLKQFDNQELEKIGEYIIGEYVPESSIPFYRYYKLPNEMIIVQHYDYSTNKGKLYTLEGEFVGNTNKSGYIKIYKNNSFI